MPVSCQKHAAFLLEIINVPDLYLVFIFLIEIIERSKPIHCACIFVPLFRPDLPHSCPPVVLSDSLVQQVKKPDMIMVDIDQLCQQHCETKEDLVWPCYKPYSGRSELYYHCFEINCSMKLSFYSIAGSLCSSLLVIRELFV